MAASLGKTTAAGEFLAPYVPSPEALVDRMLDIARVGPGDTVYDVGAGDGRIVVAAAQRFGARAVGVELDDARFALSSARIRDLGLEPRARMVHGDLLGTDFRPASVVTLYQLPAVNEMLRPALERQLRPGARVVTLDFPVPGWEAAQVETGRLTDGSQHAIYLYSMSQIRKEPATRATAKASYAGVTADGAESGKGGDATATGQSSYGDAKGGQAGGGAAPSGQSSYGDAKGGQAGGGAAASGQSSYGDAKAQAGGGDAASGQSAYGDAKGGQADSGKGGGAAASGQSSYGDAKAQAGGGDAASGQSAYGDAKGGQADSGKGGGATAPGKSSSADAKTGAAESGNGGDATMASAQTIMAGSDWLELQGVPAGQLKSVEGGDASADVVTEKMGSDSITRKHIAGVKYEDITVSLGMGMSGSVYDWIDKTMQHVDQRLNGAIVTTGFDNKEVSRLNFFNATISEIGFPAPDSTSKDRGYITLKLTPEYTTRVPGSGQKLSLQPVQQKQWNSANFRLKLAGLDCTRVTQIDALTIMRPTTSHAVGELRDYEKEPAPLQIPNLAITLKESGSDGFRQWHENFVIKGNSGQTNEKNGTLDYLSQNMQDVLFTLTFQHLGIFRLTPDKRVAGSEQVRHLRAEMYCEEMGFQYGSSAASTKGTGAAASAAAAPAAAPLSWVPSVSTAYIQPFAVDVAQKQDKEAPALSADLTAVPLRLGRPIRFRS